jgi:uncharacterized protein (DUF433 family)
MAIVKASSEIPKHIEVRKSTAGRRAFIRDTRVRVADIVQLYRLYEKEEEVVERILRSLPHLTLAQIHDALAYWGAHEDEIDRELQAENEILA